MVFKVKSILQTFQKALEKWQTGVFKLLYLIFHLRYSTWNRLFIFFDFIVLIKMIEIINFNFFEIAKEIDLMKILSNWAAIMA